jgi:hypothetical protein
MCCLCLLGAGQVTTGANFKQAAYLQIQGVDPKSLYQLDQFHHISAEIWIAGMWANACSRREPTLLNIMYLSLQPAAQQIISTYSFIINVIFTLNQPFLGAVMKWFNSFT